MLLENCRILPSTFLQEEVQNSTLQRQVRGTVKAEQLMGNPEIPVIAVLVYNTESVNFWQNETRFSGFRRQGKFLLRR